jgi:hypothetical protein
VALKSLRRQEMIIRLYQVGASAAALQLAPISIVTLVFQGVLAAMSG